MPDLKKALIIRIISIAISVNFLFINNAYSLRLPLKATSRIEYTIQITQKLRQDISKLINSDISFEEALSEELIPCPMKNKGLNHTSFILEAIRQIVAKFNKEYKVGIKLITVVNQCSLANNRFMIGSDIDRMNIYCDNELSSEQEDIFYSILKRCGINMENAYEEIKWILVENGVNIIKDEVAVYENGKIPAISISYFPESGKNDIREQLFNLWYKNRLKQKEKDLIVKLHKIRSINVINRESRHLDITDSELISLK